MAEILRSVVPLLHELGVEAQWEIKDPLGVIQAYRLVKKHDDVRLILAGGGATDDPEGEKVLSEVREAAGDDPDILTLLLPPDSRLEINAL